jgi:Family of unknown function (DUF6529)
MDGLVDWLTRSNVDQVKTVLASAVFAVAFYQVALMGVGYGKVRLSFLKPKAASLTHRAIGDTLVALSLFVAFLCLAYFGIEDGIEHARDDEATRAAVHVGASFTLVAVFGLKIAVVRWLRRLDFLLPVLGLTLLALLAVVWATSAGDYLWSG